QAFRTSGKEASMAAPRSAPARVLRNRHQIARASLLLGLLAALPAVAQKEKESYAPGQVIVLAEPGVIRLPAGLARATAGEVQIAAAPVRRIFARSGV